MPKKPQEPKPMLCYICQQRGHGPLSQDAYGYRHSYECPTNNSTLKAESNSTISLNWHKGKMCIVDFEKTCQEDACSDCMIFINRTEGIT